MNKCQTVLSVLFCVMLSTLPACGNSEEKAGAPAENELQTIDACILLSQQEVDSLFAQSPGPGRPDSPTPQVQGCVWPAEGVPKFMLQVVAAPANVRESIDPGEGYRVIELAGLSGQAAAAIQQANPKYGITEGVAILGIVRGEYMVTLSPVNLEIKEGSPEFERLKELADVAAQRL